MINLVSNVLSSEYLELVALMVFREFAVCLANDYVKTSTQNRVINQKRKRPTSTWGGVYGIFESSLLETVQERAFIYLVHNISH